VTTWPPSVSPVYKQFGSLDVSQICRLPRPVTGLVINFFHFSRLSSSLSYIFIGVCALCVPLFRSFVPPSHPVSFGCDTVQLTPAAIQISPLNCLSVAFICISPADRMSPRVQSRVDLWKPPSKKGKSRDWQVVLSQKWPKGSSSSTYLSSLLVSYKEKGR
jgi:hypothetical protein